MGTYVTNTGLMATYGGRFTLTNLDSQGAIYLCESAKAGAVLIFWHELAINGYASMNAIKRQELIDADFQRLRKLIWPEDDR